MTFPVGVLAAFSGPDGAGGFRLGPAAAGVRYAVADGEAAALSQVADWTDGAPALLRFRASVRGSRDALAATQRWRVTIVRDGVDRVDFPAAGYLGEGDGARPYELGDLAVPLLGLAGADGTVAVSLAFRDDAPAGELYAELPSVALSDFVLDASAALTLINRIPSPGQTNVAVGGPGSFAEGYGIFVEVHQPAASPPANHPLFGAVVSFFVGGVAQSVTITPLDGNRTARVSTLLAAPLPQGTEIVVRLRADFAAGGTLDEEWSFFTEDLAAPELTSARARSLFDVRAVWNEAVLAEDPAGASDALNPANWSLELLSASIADGLPAVVPSAASITRVNGRMFDITFDSELTRGARYALVAVNVVDLAYDPNPVAPPDTRAELVGFAPTQPAARRFSMLDWLPRMNVAEDDSGDLRAFVACLQEVADLLLYDVDAFALIFDSDRAPLRFLDAILQGLGNPFQFALSEVDKRRLVRLLVPIYQLKGTDRGIVDAVRFFVGVEVEIILSPVGPAWDLGVSLLGVDTYLGGSSLYDKLSFWVRSAVALTDAQRSIITAIVEYMKRAEAHFRGFLEPTPEVPATPFWELGTSLLGVDTVLGPG